MRLLARAITGLELPAVEKISEAQAEDPFRILIATLLSARTQDATTAGACERLAGRVVAPDDLRRVSLAELERLIFPVGFYRTKARMLRRLPDVLDARFQGRLPETVEELCELPGVGRKVANLVVALGFGKPAICVDVHVHRISNRFGLVRTRTPFETEMALRRVLPRRFWRTWNSYLVAFGQTRCRPVRPRCDGCPLRQWCDAA